MEIFFPTLQRDNLILYDAITGEIEMKHGHFLFLVLEKWPFF